jgi:Family of unknown function (DUF6689)
MRTALRASLFIALATASGAWAQTPIPLTISGNTASGTIALPGDIGAELTISFETVWGLTPTALEATATLVDPADPGLAMRLPGGVSVLDDFPVLVRIRPTPNSTLAFRGVVDIWLHTENLRLDPYAPKALFKAPDGGFFSDITTSEAYGSYRVCGSGGGFSEFLIVADREILHVVLLIDTVIVDKFVRLQATLTQYSTSMPLLVYLTLQARLNEARSLFDGGDVLGAIAKITSFSSYAKAHSGADIPDLWQASNPGLVNVAGLLRSGADTLKFSLVRSTGP